MAAGDRLMGHKCEEDKVLGCRYNVNKDSLSLAPCNIDSEASTKRRILSQSFKVFDPLNVASSCNHKR